MSNRSDDWLGALFSFVVVLPTMASFGVGAIVLAYQAKNWLKYGRR